MDPVSVDVERRLWDSAFSLVCAIVGSSAAVHCLFRLPLMFQMFHPGSFLLALCLCMLLLAWPLVVIELAIGQRMRLAAVPAMDAIVAGGRGIAFCSVIIGSLLSTAYSSSSLGVVVSPLFDDVLQGRERIAALQSSSSKSVADNSTNTITTSVVPSPPLMTVTTTINDSASSSGGANLPAVGEHFLTIGTWYSVVALFVIWSLAAYLCWAFMGKASHFSRIMLPLPLILWCVMAIYASAVVDNDALFHFLLVPNGSFWNGRLLANAAAQAWLLLQVGTGVTITFGSKAKAVHSVVNVSCALFALALIYAFFVTVASAGSMTVVASWLTASADGNSSSNNITHATMSEMLVSGNSTNAGLISPDDFARLQRVPVLLPALFVAQGGPGARFLGVVLFVSTLIAGVFAITLLLSSFFNSLADLHVAMRSPLTCFLAAAVCFTIGAPMAKGSVPADVMIALDQAVVGTCLPIFVLAESIGIAYGGWGGPSVFAQLRDIYEEDLTWSGKIVATFDLLRNFGTGRFRNLLGTDNSSSVLGRLTVTLLPFFTKLFIPLIGAMCALTTVITFAMSEQQSGAADAVFAVVIVATAVVLYVAVWRSPPPNAKAPPWIEMGAASPPDAANSATATHGTTSSPTTGPGGIGSPYQVGGAGAVWDDDEQ